MRTKLLLYYVAVFGPSLIVLGAHSGCQPYPPDGGDTTQTTTVIVGGPTNPGASPSPGDGAPLPPGSRVAIFAYGQICGNDAAPAKLPLKVGCRLLITATPKDSANNDIPPTVHGPFCSWTNSDANIADLQVSGDNQFNATLKGNSPGRAVVTATVKSLTGTLSVDVVP